MKKIILYILKSLPLPIKLLLKRTVEWINKVNLHLFSANPLLASIYYCVFNRSFDREHFSVLEGRRKYYQSLSVIGMTSPLLRRNVHRLEKGLIMRPRRSVFAENYILETVKCYHRAYKSEGYSEGELRWATDVLDEYFNVVKDTHLISQARDEYSRIKLNLGLESYGYETNTSSFSPYPLSQRPQIAISFDQLHSLFLRRRSVRWYLQKPVPEELIRKAINSAALAPSACNRQPYRFIVANVPALAARIAECAGGTGGFAHQLPSIIVVIGDLSAYPKERDRHLIYIDASLVSMQLMLAAETLGLSTCPINWPDVNSSEKKIQALLRLPEYERVIMLIAIGFGDPKSGIPYSQKKQDSLIMQMYSEP